MQSNRLSPYQIITLMIIGLAIFVAYDILNSGLLAISFPSALTTEDSEPLDVVNAFHTAINSHDIDAAMTLFTEDAVVTDKGQVSEGQDQIRTWLQYSQMETGLRLEMIHSQVSGEKVFWHDMVYNLSREKYVPNILRREAIIQKGRIKSLSISFLPMPDGK